MVIVLRPSRLLKMKWPGKSRRARAWAADSWPTIRTGYELPASGAIFAWLRSGHKRARHCLADRKREAMVRGGGVDLFSRCSGRTALPILRGADGATA